MFFIMSISLEKTRPSKKLTAGKAEHVHVHLKTCWVENCSIWKCMDNQLHLLNRLTLHLQQLHYLDALIPVKHMEKSFFKL